MKKFLKEKWPYLLVSFYSLCIALMWLALRVNYAGISKALGGDALCKSAGIMETLYPTTFEGFIIMYLPVILCVVFFLLFIYSVLNIFLFKKKNVHMWVLFGLNILWTIAIVVVIILGAQDYLFVILPKFFNTLIYSILFILFACILFFPIEGKRSILVKCMILAIVLVSSIVIGFGLKFNYFTYKPVVYAVEDEYQIVFSTNDESVVYVEINNERYYDTYAGSERSKELVHKVTVDQSVLDNAGSYKIVARQLAYRGPFGAYYGSTIEEEYSFTAPKSNDGINYYAVSDVHESGKAAITTVKKAIEKLGAIDFFVINGDTISDVEYYENANYVNWMAHEITNGSIPVIYARGNHEIKGNYSEDLYRYVGSKNQKFYYSFSLDNGTINGLVLDLGEDHNPYLVDDTKYDDWWEYYDTDRFNDYRQEQTNFIESYTYPATSVFNMVVCHIPVCYVNSRLDHLTWKIDWVKKLNAKNVDVALYAHQHEQVPYLVGLTTPSTYSKAFLIDGATHHGIATEAYNFNGFMVGKSSNTQDGNEVGHGGNEYCGLYGKVVGNEHTIQWTNTLGEIVNVDCGDFQNNGKQTSYTYTLE